MRGAGAGSTDMVYLTGEAGVGGGIITGGRRLRGRGGYAGEVGHMIVNPGGRVCRCGARGCWETEIGEAALLDGAPQDGLDAFVAAALDGDAAALAKIGRFAGWLGIGVGNLVNIFNPEVVILGGVLRQLLPLVREEVVRALWDGGPAAPREGLRLLPPALGADSALLGAAELAFAPLLADPLATMAAPGMIPA